MEREPCTRAVLTLGETVPVISLSTGAVAATTTVPGCPTVPQVTGPAQRTAEHSVVADPADSLVPGFLLP